MRYLFRRGSCVWGRDIEMLTLRVADPVGRGFLRPGPVGSVNPRELVVRPVRGEEYRTLDAVRREPGRTAYEIAGSMAWSIRCRSWAEFPLTQKYFAVGEALAHLDYLMVRGQVQRREEHGKWRYYTL